MSYHYIKAVGWVKRCQTFDDNLKETTKSETQQELALGCALLNPTYKIMRSHC
ncbi:MAG: hypothetical protein F6J92_27925 [Symploca sp. SIO1A3]|nr:hypothetical protein [Symploca sp. SIO1A3]